MTDLVTEKLLEKAENRFILSIAAAKRARQLKDGAVPLVDRKDNPDLIVALEEIMEDKIAIEIVNPESDTPDVIIKEK